MSHVTVALTAYTEGTLPDVCIVSGRPTGARILHATEVLPDGMLERIIHRIEQRILTRRHFGRVTVVRGLIPVHPAVSRLLTVRRRVATVGIWIGVMALVAVAWSAASWAPMVAIGLLALTGMSIWLRVATARRMPGVSVQRDRALVHLTRVHPDFATALERTR